jgi:uncharacterized protein YndB with AHSA1/START domain
MRVETIEPTGPGAPGIERSVHIAAPAAAVWPAIVDPEVSRRWLGGFRLVSTWEPGARVSLSGTLNGHPHEEAGEVLVFEPGRRLRYSHWSRLWRVPDLPENRAVLTIELEPEGEGTRVWIRQALPDVVAIAPHADFFWRVGLGILRKLVEGDPGR